MVSFVCARAAGTAIKNAHAAAKKIFFISLLIYLLFSYFTLFVLGLLVMLQIYYLIFNNTRPIVFFQLSVFGRNTPQLLDGA